MTLGNMAPGRSISRLVEAGLHERVVPDCGVIKPCRSIPKKPVFLWENQSSLKGRLCGGPGWEGEEMARSVGNSG